MGKPVKVFCHLHKVMVAFDLPRCSIGKSGAHKAEVVREVGDAFSDFLLSLDKLLHKNNKDVGSKQAIHSI